MAPDGDLDHPTALAVVHEVGAVRPAGVQLSVLFHDHHLVADLERLTRHLLRGAPQRPVGGQQGPGPPVEFPALNVVVGHHRGGSDRVDVVSDGRDAVRATLTTRYDLVIMDCQMPEMDDYLAKPVRIADLLAAVARWAERPAGP